MICGYSRYEERAEQMQTINHGTTNIHPIMDDIDRLFALLSDAPQRMLVKPVFDRSFKSLVDVFNKFNPWEYTWEVAYTDTPYPPLNALQNKSIILCFSGGKDSIAAAIKYKELGYDVHLYHLKHINPSFADEWECAQRSADLLGMPIFFDDIGFKDNGALPVGSVCMRKGKRALSNADDDSLLARYFHFGCKVTNNY